MKAYGGGGAWLQNGVRSDLPSSGYYREDSLSYEGCYVFYICFLLVCILGEKLASRVVVWFWFIELNWT